MTFSPVGSIRITCKQNDCSCTALLYVLDVAIERAPGGATTDEVLVCVPPRMLVRTAARCQAGGATEAVQITR